jgi:ADP-heptose:LPS heptosyltransferase
MEPALAALIQASPSAQAMSIVNSREFGCDLLKMGEFLSSARYMLTNDSGLAHMATLYGVPMTSLTSGLGQPSYTGQNGSGVDLIMHPTECYGCAVGISTTEAEAFRCDYDWACMNKISTETVVDSVRQHA